VSDAPDGEARPYTLAFLTDQWEWESELATSGLEQAKAASREALLRLVREEGPELACITLLQDGRKIGVWDWVAKQAFWTPA